MRKAITIGKFWPFHYGHDLMITSALAIFDELHIIIGNDDPIKNKKVQTQMQARYDHNWGHKITYHQIVDDTVAEEYDENGTAVDEEFWKSWTKTFKFFAPDATHFVSSDLYGKEAARRLGIEWFPVDPARQSVKISGTKIRSNLVEGWKYIVEEARYDHALKIAVLGPESSGKSTAISQLNIPGVATVPEWGRTISEAKEDLTLADFMSIITTQACLVEAAVMHSPVVVTDTEFFTTINFLKHYLPDETQKYELLTSPEAIETLVINAGYDRYIHFSATEEWTNDGQRIFPEFEDRKKFADEVSTMAVKHTSAKHHHIDSQNWASRTTAFNNIIERATKDHVYS